MTSPNTGLRRTALAVLAVGAALGASACSAGQVSQTAYQVAAVDGGHGTAGDLEVNDLVVVLPETGDADAKVGFVASYTGSGFGDPVSLDRVQIDGVEVQVGESQPLERGCSLVVSSAEGAVPAPAQEGVCVEQTTATLPAGELAVGTSVPATLTFSNGDTVQAFAGVITEVPDSGEYTRPSETVAPSEGH
ncbi:hypothetical protein [Rhodococcus sp. IEGM 1408]|uniref:hypothetical protein n=1 Tax=Rhodococcus sp. IEGM 1408 TaxID=3082220 RepID=UPI002952FE5F|nr:hypothetical protein [Rhodococcus sp. IEGM 1408]MDV8002343.1 hypothetical protein [Rhodococcus sp. IEGM 1408]